MRNKMYKVGFWGQLGPEENVADGQAIRTRIIIDQTQKRIGKNNVLITNTYEWKKHPIRFFVNTISLFVKSSKVVILPADNGFKVIVPMYNFLLFFVRKEIYYIVIGGFLTELLRRKPRYIKLLRKYKAIFVQTTGLKDDLERFGMNNVYHFPNFKPISSRNVEEIKINENKIVKLIFFSRISFTKGVEDAIEAVRISNQKLEDSCITLDFYGLIDENYRNRFEELQKNNSFIKYNGIANYLRTVEVIKDYFIMLFPTYYHGEGFAGVIIDTFFSGIPIIATDWLYNKDMIVDGVNGFLVPPKTPEAIADKILKFYNNRNLHNQISLTNLKESEKYQVGNIMEQMFEKLNL